MWCTFIDELGQSQRDAVRFRPYHMNYSETEARVAARFGESMIAKTTSYETALRQSKLVVCTYPQTTFSEAIASGPTILLFDPSLWEIHRDFSDLLSTLHDAGIAHFNPSTAAEFVEATWLEINSWWGTRKVSSAIATYLKDACLVTRNPDAQWGAFLRSERESAVTDGLDLPKAQRRSGSGS
jgi:putative transferase (TIGR04331 family)